MNRTHRFFGLAAAMLLALGLFVSPKSASAHELCFDETGYCINHPFSDYWEDNGGLPVFGYPITDVADEVNIDTGLVYPTQWFERNRFESHIENDGTPYAVLLGLLGKEALALQGRDWAAEPRESGPKDDCLWFEQTGHNVCNMEGNLGFKTYWETHGLKDPELDAFGRSLQLFGLPLTEPKMETNSSGDTVMTQWFERARFEWHPGNSDEFKVLLGLLGKEVWAGYEDPQPTPDPEPTPDECAGIPEARFAAVEPSNCVALGSVIALGFTGFTPGDEVGFWITSPEGENVGTPRSFSLGESDTLILPLDTGILYPGLWQFNVQNTSGTHTAVAYVKVLALQAAECKGVPAAVDGSISPTCLKEATNVSISGHGFNGDEEIGFYVTDPDGAVVDLGDIFGGQVLRANADGSFNATITINGNILPAGVYAFTFEGKTSGHKTILYFEGVH